jgi:hypothetical protein
MARESEALEVHRDLHRRGLISNEKWAKLSAQSGTKPQKTKMASFEDRGGLRDQGGIRERGIKETGRDQIDERKSIGTPARASGAPSKGGRVNAYGEPGRAAIDDGRMQRPAFPSGGKLKAANAKKKLTAVPKDRSKSAPSEYGGPSNRKYG